MAHALLWWRRRAPNGAVFQGDKLMYRTLVALAVIAQAHAAVAAEVSPGSEPSNASPDPAADTPVAHEAHAGFVEHSGWYVAPTMGVTTVKGEATMDFGLRGAWLINRRF